MVRLVEKIRLHMRGVVHLKHMLGTALIALALAQNALDSNLQRGGGSALDRSLQQGQAVNGATARQDYRSRNLVVTGDAAGGRGFRGSVGYTAAEDFRGATSGDTTRSFRANSSVSSADALASVPMNDRFSIATGMGVTAYRRDFVSTGTTSAVGTKSSGASWDPGLVAQPSPTATNNGRMQLDMLTRQASTHTDLSSTFQPTTVTLTRSSNNRSMRIIASPFTGIVAVPDNDLIESLSHGVYSSALMRADWRSGRVTAKKMLRSYLSGVVVAGEAKSGKSNADGAKVVGLEAGGSIDSQSGASEPDPSTGANGTGIVGGSREFAEIKTPYDRVLTAVGNRFRESQGEKVDSLDTPVDLSSLTEMGRVIKDLRDGFQLVATQSADGTDRLRGAPDPTDPASAASAASAALNSDKPITDGSAPEQTSGEKAGSRDTPDSSDGKKSFRRLTGDEAYLLLAHGQTISQLDAGTREALDTMLQSGDRSMRVGRYLTAEKAFTAGALIAPSNPLPLAGLANSQVAAGLQISGAITLRRLFTTWPEMIDTRYGFDILGSIERLRTIGAESILKGDGSKYQSDYGFVAAYVGHQIGDRPLVENGLSLMERDVTDQAFTEALRKIWLRPATPTQPSPVIDEAHPSK